MEGTIDGWSCSKSVDATLKYTQMIYETLGIKDYPGFPQPAP
ncbi:hypothetical protein [Sorangium sp. So ce887]